jgi:predicted RNA methylase
MVCRTDTLYEPRRFKSTVAWYGRYRLAYPDRLIARVAGLAGLEPGDAVLDLGAGTGMLAVPFARLGLAVTAMDPEPAMLAAAAAAAAAAGAGFPGRLRASTNKIRSTTRRPTTPVSRRWPKQSRSPSA